MTIEVTFDVRQRKFTEMGNYGRNDLSLDP